MDTSLDADQPRWSTVIFDLDGTLVDTVELIVASFRHAESSVRQSELEPAAARSLIGRSLVDIYGDAPDAEAMVEAFTHHNRANLETMQTGYDGIPQLLRDLSGAGVKVGVATSKSRETAVASVRAAGIADLVELATTVDETTLHKPHPEPVLHARRRLDADDESCVYVGDAIWDVRAARAAGIDQISVAWGAGEVDALRAEQPSAGVATTVDELRVLLLG